MKSRSEYGRAKRSFAARLQQILMRKSRSAQTRTYKLIRPLLDEFETSQSRLVFNVENISKITQVRKIVDAALTEEGSVIARWIARQVNALTDLNRLYFKSFVAQPIDVVDVTARENIMLRLGYNLKDGTLIKGGYLDDISTNTNVAQQVGAELNRALGNRTGLRDFRKQFADLFTSDINGLGLTDRHFYRATFDIFQQYDRAIAKEYADQLELNYAIYSGTIKNTTRSFCSERVNKVFTRAEIERWREEDFDGKPSRYNPSTDLGGYNCRHSLDWISDELAARFGRNVEADQNQTVEA